MLGPSLTFVATEVLTATSSPHAYSKNRYINALAQDAPTPGLLVLTLCADKLGSAESLKSNMLTSFFPLVPAPTAST